MNSFGIACREDSGQTVRSIEISRAFRSRRFDSAHRRAVRDIFHTEQLITQNGTHYNGQGHCLACRWLPDRRFGYRRRLPLPTVSRPSPRYGTNYGRIPIKVYEESIRKPIYSSIPFRTPAGSLGDERMSGAPSGVPVRNGEASAATGPPTPGTEPTPAAAAALRNRWSS